VHGGIGVVEDVDGEPGLGFPGEGFDHAFSRDRHGLIRSGHPADGIAQQPGEIGMAGLPHGAFDIAGEEDQPALALFAHHGGCVATGNDVLKYLGLGADVVMVGRHIRRAAYGGGAEGVELFMNKMRTELASAMVLTGVGTIPKVDSSIL
jgi:hypothetical protein